MNHAVPLIQLPMNDVERACAFYGQVLGKDLVVHDGHGDERTVVFLTEDEGSPRTMLLKSPGFTPTKDGAVVYLGLEGSIEEAVKRVEAAGGTVSFGPFGTHDEGFIINMVDSEGNSVGIATRS